VEEGLTEFYVRRTPAILPEPPVPTPRQRARAEAEAQKAAAAAANARNWNQAVDGIQQWN
jgi:hypothetical protein